MVGAKSAYEEEEKTGYEATKAKTSEGLENTKEVLLRQIVADIKRYTQAFFGLQWVRILRRDQMGVQLGGGFRDEIGRLSVMVHIRLGLTGETSLMISVARTKMEA
ncbi:hypothetical protein Tco_0446203 [Tanacetum coccineum]